MGQLTQLALAVVHCCGFCCETLMIYMLVVNSNGGQCITALLQLHGTFRSHVVSTVIT
jgi:hypothetical protein